VVGGNALAVSHAPGQRSMPGEAEYIGGSAGVYTRGFPLPVQTPVTGTIMALGIACPMARQLDPAQSAGSSAMTDRAEFNST
jgi:hypothetical protein